MFKFKKKVMNSSKIYQITIEKDIDLDINHPFFKEFSNFLDKADSDKIGFSNDNKIFTKLPDYKVDKICDTLSKYNIDFSSKDVTKSVILGDIQKKYPGVETLTPRFFKDFRYIFTSIDNILDKISERGIESLDKIDKKILSRNSTT
jgi:hypothetical protein